MSSVASSAAASASNTCSTVSYSAFPNKDVGCATGKVGGLPDNYKDLMEGCCKTAPVESWADDCALYCLAIGQSVGDLTACFQKAGITPSDIFCSGNMTATATATQAPESTSNPSSASGSASTAGATTGAAVALVPQQGVSKAGLGMLAMLLVSGAVGALL